MIFDIVIAGGGPGGSYLGSLLAQKGLKVGIIDKEKFPRNKPCGGGVSPKALKLLNLDLSSVTEQSISKVMLSYRNEQVVIRDDYNFFGITVDRLKFDSLLIENAINSGAYFFDNNEVTGFEQKNDLIQIETLKRNFSCKYLIGADGVKSRIRSLLFHEKIIHSVPSVTAKIVLNNKDLEKFNNSILFDYGVIENGYGWIFPLKNQVNIGVYSPFPKRELSKSVKYFINLYPGLKKNIAELKIEVAQIPLINLKGKYQKGNVWLIGDAAGLCESFFGEGISYSMESGNIAYKILTEKFEEKGNNYEYNRQIVKRIQREQFYSRLLSKVFYYNLAHSYYYAIRSNYLCELFAESLAGRITYKTLFRKALLSSPYWLFSKRTPISINHIN